MIKNNFCPGKLTQQREIKGLNKTKLAELLEISQQVISQYEVGRTIPSMETIKKMSKVLNVSTRFFFIKPIGSREKVDVFFRSLSSATKISQRKIVRYNDYIQDFLAIFSEYINFPKIDFPDLKWLKLDNEGLLDEEQIDKTAIELRKHWNIGTRPISNMVKLLESKGVIIMRQPYDCKKIDAVSWWQTSIKRPIIFLSSNNKTSVHSRFSLAHELGHILLHAGIKINKDNLKRIEKEANRFAGAFLLSGSSFSQEIFSASLEHFWELKRRWKVSVQAMIYRCQDLELLSDNQILYLRKKINKGGFSKRDKIDEEILTEKPAFFEKAITGLIENNLLKKSDFEEKLGLSGKEIEELLDLSSGILSEDNEGENIVYFDFKNQKDE